jgi:hypothetical protein
VSSSQSDANAADDRDAPGSIHLDPEQDVGRRIAEALQPVLEQVRQERSRRDGQPGAGPAESRSVATATSAASSGRRSAAGRQDDRDTLVDETPTTQSNATPDGDGSRSGQRRQRETADATETRADGERGSGLLSQLGTSIAGAVPQLLAAQSEEAVKAFLDSVLDRILSDSMRETIRSEAEESADELLAAMLQIVPDQDTRRDLLRQSEPLLRSLLRESVETIFDGDCRDALQRHLESAVEALADGEIGEALRQVVEGLKELVEGVLGVLQRHWVQVMGIILHVFSTVLKEAVTSALTGGASESLDSAEEKVQQVGDKLREQLTEAIDELRHSAEEARDELQQRVKDGLESALHGGGGTGKQLGRQPNGRPPGIRPPPGRPPTGRPPSGVPPSLERQRD